MGSGATRVGAGIATGGISELWYNKTALTEALVGKAPTPPGLPAALPPAPDQSDEAIQNSKLMERRRQIGLSNRNQTWLTGARGDQSPAQIGYNTLLGE